MHLLSPSNASVQAMNDNDDDDDTIADHLLLHNPTSYLPPLFSSWNDKLRPIKETIDKLLNLKVINEGISVPTIVVVGNRDSGKSSLIESLIGISLPCAQETCTRVPLIIKLQNHPYPVTEFLLKYKKKSVRIINEMLISEAINNATMEVVGEGKKIGNVPLTLLMKKRDIPDLTIIDLPGIHRDNSEQTMGITMEFEMPEDNIILNVASATSDLSNWKRSMDYKEERTLGVVAKCDQVRYGDVFDAVGINKYNIDRYRYIYVRNRINDETHNKARIEESTLFERLHRVNGLPESEKSMLGIPALANKLVQMQLAFILKCLPDILKKINEGLNALNLELNQLPNNLMSVPEAMATFMHVIGSLKETLQKMLIQGDYNEYEDDKQMHFNARLVEMLDRFSKKLHLSDKFSESFLVEEVKVVEESNGIFSSNFPPHSCLLRKKVNNIYTLPLLVVKEVCGYLETVCVRVLIDHYVSYPKLLSSMRKATHNVMEKMKLEFSHGDGEDHRLYM
ncbi:unnamed protein product [Lactuca virosa]|uniref:Dynamin-type G domain-containing protein n=1 Tax=Lactuca virosa TaxID=75947 RepID=A0AAU9M022_9ASTR|nr:unnamed protein product [Lactuca virosa]